MNVKKVKVENDEGEIIRIFDSVKEAAAFYGIRPETMTYRAKTKFSKDGETTSFIEVTRYARCKKRRLSAKEEANFVFDNHRHCKVFYSLVKKHICITPCPYFSSPKPFVGSSRCMDCPYFKVRDKENGFVICTGHRYSN